MKHSNKQPRTWIKGLALICIMALVLGGIGSSTLRKKNILVGGGAGDTTVGATGGTTLPDGGGMTTDGAVAINHVAGITSDKATVALFDITPTKVDLAGNAAVDIGKAGLDTAIKGTLSVAGALAVNGNAITSVSSLTTTVGSGDHIFAGGGTRIVLDSAANITSDFTTGTTRGLVLGGGNIAIVHIQGLIRALLVLDDTGASVNNKLFEIAIGSNQTKFSALNDDASVKHTFFTLGHSSNTVVITPDTIITGDLTVNGGDFIVGSDAAGNIGTTNNSNQWQFLTATSALLEGSLEIQGDTFWTGDGSGIPYGSMYNDNTDVTVTMGTAGTAVRIPSGFTQGEINLTTFGNAREITVTKAGRYSIQWNISFYTAAGSNQEIEGHIGVDNAEVGPGSAHRFIGNANDKGNMSGVAILDLAASKVLSLMIVNDTDTNNVVVNHANMVVTMVGGT